MENTTNTTTTDSINQDGPYFYALAMGENKRTSQRFDRLFNSKNANSAAFVALSNVPKYRDVISVLLTACRDHGLDRTNLTRSQIVMSYNKAQKPLKLIAKFVELHGVQALLDNIAAANVDVTKSTLDIRIDIVKSCV